MKLNLQQKKYATEDNFRKIISIITGLMSSVGEVASQCLKDYIDDGSRIYSKGEICIYDGYIWEALAVTQGAWDNTKWTKIGTDDFTELDVDTIKGYLNLSQEELDNLQNLIDDAQITLTKTHSSSKIYMDIQQCLEDGKTFTLKEINKLNGASYKVVTSTSEMTNESIIYLLASGNTYDMYIVEEDGTTTKIGNMDVNLDNYFTKAEIEADYLKKADADGKYATIVTVDGKIDKDKIVTVLDDTVTDEQVASAKVVYEELDKKIEKDNLVTVLDDTVTDEQILNALALKELLDEKNVENLFPIQYYNNTSDTRTGITATINNDRSITFKGTTTGQYFFVLWHKDNNGLGKAVALRGKTITMTGGLASPTLSLAFYDEEGNNITPPNNAMKYDFGDGLTIKVPDNAYSVYSYYYSSANKTLDCTVYPMLEIGNVAHDYCPPNGTALTKGDIGDSINSDSTADEIVSAKLAYTNLIRGNSASQSYLDEIGTNDVLQLPEGKYIIHESVTYANLPEGVKGGYLEIWNMNGGSHETPFNSAWKYRVVKLQDFNTKKSYYRVLRSSDSAVFLDTGWQRVCVTKVADEANVDVTSSIDTTVASINGIAYTVKNGICYVRVNNLKPLLTCSETVILPNGTLPKASVGSCFTNISTWNETNASTILLQPKTSGCLLLWCNNNALNKAHYGMFSYPVAE